MTVETFNTLVKTFGDQSYDESDRWKSIKYITTEGQMEPIDFEYKFLCNEAYYINDDAYGAGFLFIETPYVEFEPINKAGNKVRRIVTFVALTMVNSISFKVTSVKSTNDIIDGGAN